LPSLLNLMAMNKLGMMLSEYSELTWISISIFDPLNTISDERP
jgi:hypothetical protein